MPYRETAHIEREVVLTARRAILDLYQEYSGIWDVEPETLLKYLSEAFTPDGVGSHNHVICALRMLARNGHHPEQLEYAIHALVEEGGFMSVEPVRRPLNPFTDEHVKTGWGYPQSYRAASYSEQLRVISRFFPQLNLSGKHVSQPVAIDQFHPMVIPKLSSVAKQWRIEDPYGRGYEAIIKRLSDVVQSVYRSRRSGFAKTSLDLNDFLRLEPYASTQFALKHLEMIHGGTDLVVFNGQLGIRWAGSSMRRVRWYCEEIEEQVIPGYREFVLPSYVILIHLLMQPERLMCLSSLNIYCAGDNAVKKGFFGHNGVGLAYGAGVLHFMDCSQSRPEKMYGVPTGLVPK